MRILPAGLLVLALIAGVAPARPASARGLSVEIWTDRDDHAVYQPGEEVKVRVKTSDDAYVLVYNIDNEGYVHEIYPFGHDSALLKGGKAYKLDDERPDAQLVAEGPVGQGYLVAIASLQPFNDLPWYLRESDPQADELGYEGNDKDQEEGVTAQGQIVGDPFVAMEKIRRRVLQDPKDGESFASAYVDYYVHHEVKYPRYLCYDCHRPGYYSWWDGFDPYYTTCTAFSFHVNYHWGWGPTYWYGSVPYFVYTYLPTCPPHYYHPYAPGQIWWSSWDGWHTWQSIWGGPLQRYKTPPPPGYTPPTKYDNAYRRPDTHDLPPGFLANTTGGRMLRGAGPDGRTYRPGSGGTSRGATPPDAGAMRGSRGERPLSPAPQQRGDTPQPVDRGGARPVPNTPDRGADRPAPIAPDRGGERPVPSTPDRGGATPAPQGGGDARPDRGGGGAQGAMDESYDRGASRGWNGYFRRAAEGAFAMPRSQRGVRGFDVGPRSGGSRFDGGRSDGGERLIVPNGRGAGGRGVQSGFAPRRGRTPEAGGGGGGDGGGGGGRAGR